jgi:hypothetical protein
MPDAAIVSTLRQFRAGLLAREDSQMRAMAARWLMLEATLSSEIDGLAKDFAAEKSAGRSVSQSKLYRMDRYQLLLGQLRQQTARYGDYAVGQITARQLELAGLGIGHAVQATRIVAVSASFDVLPVGAIQAMVGLAGDGSPLRRLLAASYPDAVEGLTKALVRGTALGWHPTRVARAMRDGTEMGLQRALTVARTEQLRVYRAASDAQYAETGVIRFKARLAAKSQRTCLACLARDGKIMPVSEPFFDHVNGRCVVRPLLDNEIPKGYQTGCQWFEKQGADAQRAMMGDKRYEAWQAGAFDFDDLAKVTTDPTWGKSLGVKPLRELVSA